VERVDVRAVVVKAVGTRSEEAEAGKGVLNGTPFLFSSCES
jgi:hypothetical protein